MGQWLIRREGLSGLAAEYCCKHSTLSSVKHHDKATVQITDTDNIISGCSASTRGCAECNFFLLFILFVYLVYASQAPQVSTIDPIAWMNHRKVTLKSAVSNWRLELGELRKAQA